MGASTPPLRRRYGIELGLGLVALVLAVTWLARDQGGRAVRQERETAVEALPERTPVPAAELAASEVQGGRRTEEPAREAAAETRIPSERSKKTAPAAGHFWVEVVDETGAALPNMVLALTSTRAGMPERELLAGAKTDASGRAEFALAPLEAARAAAGTAYPLTFHAELAPQEDDTPGVELPEALLGARVRLVVPESYLARRRPLRVRVEDSEGRPLAGVEVQLLARLASERDFSDPCAMSASGADGAAELTLEECHARRAAKGGGHWVHRLQAWVPFEVLPFVELGDELPKEIVVLRLPPSGSVALVVAGSTGERVREPVVGLRVPAFEGRSLPHVRVVDGHALFPAVGLGLVLELQARARGLRASGTLVASGPSVPGERVELALELGAEWPRVALHLEDEHGQPFTRELVGWIDGAPVQPQLGSLPRCDANGVLELHLPGDPEPGEKRALVLRDAGFRTVRVPLPEPLPAGVTDLGRFSFAPLARVPDAPREFLMAGRTVDAEGRAIGLARLVLTATEETGFALYATSDAEGRFHFEGRRPKGVVSVSAFATGFREARLKDARLGEQDVRLTLELGACFEASVHWDAELPATERLTFALAGQSGTLFLTPAEHLQACELLPGTYALEVRDSLFRERRPLVRIEEIVLAAGRNAPIASLAPLDLRGRLAQVRARLLRVDGQPLTGAVTVRNDDDESEQWWLEGEGVLRGVVLAGQSLQLEPQGFLPQRFTPADLEQTLTFTARDER